MSIRTRLTETLGIRHPILSAPMALASGGALAAAVTKAGGLGLIGGGYGNAEFLETEFKAAGNTRVGCGFITWSMAKNPALLTQALSHAPAAMMLSFGDPAPFAPEIKASGAKLICQCQTMAHVRDAVAAGADIIVAQGSEAGGHGALRGTLSFVPEVADYLSQHSPQTLLLAAGGIADGRGIAASLMLGADGVLVGTRFWATPECLAHQGHRQAILETNGDGTLRTNVIDIIRDLEWPAGFTIRVGANDFTETWHGRERVLYGVLETEMERYKAAYAAGDAKHSAAVFGEAAGLIHAIEPAGVILERMADEAENLLARRASALVG